MMAGDSDCAGYVTAITDDVTAADDVAEASVDCGVCDETVSSAAHPLTRGMSGSPTDEDILRNLHDSDPVLYTFLCSLQDPGDNEDAAAGLRGYTKNTQINLDILAMSSKCLDKAEEIARRVWMAGWTVVHHNHLPKWLRDNDFLICGHRPPLNSFLACFKSIFRVHTETGNIWTHLLGKRVGSGRGVELGC